MNILIVEDEVLAAERVQLLVKRYDPSINILGSLESIEETVDWLKTRQHPDLLLMDIQLSDGHSFEIFKQATVNIPVIFTTAYDNFAIEAFKNFGIDYILKPVTAESLASSIQKYKALNSRIPQYDEAEWMEKYKGITGIQYKDRFLARIGAKTFFIQTEDVCCFIADNKTVFLVDKNNNRFIINYSIEKLESVLDPHYFFRINRKMIVHSKGIELIKPYNNNRLKLSLKNISFGEEIIVSRERVQDFKKWAEG
ncbi:LytTR family DNA-binding domain-containing protein [Ferruginibacter sp. HRS2-29]|uniref:LytR/AlgR family response regulator transcription factor n=1 Tax=Ferruginibacter sp. HRS2-29 TaxID=2487334 RepID=UPI0020CBDC55|nr:LytTR family DNA-binding domain-containing protein [Ferruginibacter sp. HRS2-29]MCP9752298.1 DNA-binding response regulator [Ferruginibacter sp. HRS2-29]